MRYVLTFILFIICTLSFSQDENKNLLYMQEGFVFPYNINEPDEIIKLPDDLEEVSGIAHLKDDILPAYRMKR